MISRSRMLQSVCLSPCNPCYSCFFVRSASPLHAGRDRPAWKINSCRGFGKPRTMRHSVAKARHDPAPPRCLPAAVPSDGRQPRGVHGPRPRTDAVAGPARLPRGVDRRAPFRRLGAYQFAGVVHRRCCGAHTLDPLRHWCDLPALPQPADDGEPRGDSSSTTTRAGASCSAPAPVSWRPMR